MKGVDMATSHLHSAGEAEVVDRWTLTGGT